MFYAAFVEAMLAVSTSCFPTMDAIDDDDTPLSEQKKVKLCTYKKIRFFKLFTYLQITIIQRL